MQDQDTAIVNGLADLGFEGEVRSDLSSRLMYATDASIYRAVPLAVVYPAHAEDIKRVLAFAAKQRIGIIPRAAGTSLAGQVVGSGIVADLSRHFSKILEINTEERWVRMEPGVVPDELNALLRSHQLLFGPETSTSNRCNIGGMIGNNACGLHSLVYGSVRDHIIEAKTILHDGSEVTFGELTGEQYRQKCLLQSAEGEIYREIDRIMSDPENRDAIRRDYPDFTIPRRNTGYALDDLLYCEPFNPGPGRSINLARLIAGSEGTLALVTEVKMGLVPLPPPVKALSCVHLQHRHEAFRANLIALRRKPWAVELIDNNILSLAATVESQKRNRFFIEGEPGAVLIVEFCAGNREEIIASANSMVAEMQAEGLGYAFPLVWGDDVKRVWDLRKAGLGILSNIPGDAKPISLIEDCAVDVNRLGDFVEDIEKMLASYGKESVYHAHIGTGELHIRPLINLKDADEAKLLRTVAEETARTVKKYRGSMSGEHGDGRLRGEFIPLIIGVHNYLLNKRIKKVFDPHGILNPGKITDTPPMDSSLRYIPGKPTPELKTWYDFSDSGGVVRAAEKCNGSGDCRKSSAIGGTMCPSYMATGDERLTTRARANILREMLYAKRANPWDSREIYEILDLCLACKGCRSECPSGMDIAKLKSEFLQHYNDVHPPSLRTRMIASLPKIYSLFSSVPGIFNFFAANKFSSLIIKKVTGFASERSIPLLAPMTFMRWLKRNLPGLNPATPAGEVCLFVDEFTNHNDLSAGITTARLLTGLGYRITVTGNTASARTYISKGFLRKAKRLIVRNIEAFAPLVNVERPLIGIEPSAILGFRDEFPDLAGDELRPEALRMAQHTYTLEEFIAREFSSGRIKSDMFTEEPAEVLVHVHCQEKAITTSAPVLAALGIPANYKVREIPSGCCGMAGAFGYEKEHYDLSRKVGELVLFPDVRAASASTIICAPGTSCRHHVKDGTGRIALHPAEVLFRALRPG
ncbi:MAG: FAD-linked oxidase C-terminal domain-containing protein [Bacteroidales bacterium]|nr:FAD-linked oxidase C-terminal domain-containing protein [Bacteroidales bacterium]MDT8373005.1 FAD-linked oxidase C-terminal domain-containing protein [Bacteroidales bacterium]